MLSALLSVVEVRSSVEEFTGPEYKSHLINQIASVRYSYNLIITRLPIIVVLLCSQTPKYTIAFESSWKPAALGVITFKNA